jgi:hypothetical protein
VRAIECPCGHHLEGADDDELFRLAREHVDREMADMSPNCFTTKKLEEGQLVQNARLAGATPLWEWIGETATVLSY